MTRETDLMAGFSQKFLARKTVLGGHLRKQEAAMVLSGNHQPVFANLNDLRCDRKQIRQ